ncbi:MAG TPA: hypothetical protein VGH28_28285 [Polyangiaceae bacterium]|jgi:hypothetical protein
MPTPKDETNAKMTSTVPAFDGSATANDQPTAPPSQLGSRLRRGKRSATLLAPLDSAAEDSGAEKNLEVAIGAPASPVFGAALALRGTKTQTLETKKTTTPEVTTAPDDIPVGRIDEAEELVVTPPLQPAVLTEPTTCPHPLLQRLGDHRCALCGCIVTAPPTSSVAPAPNGIIPESEWSDEQRAQDKKIAEMKARIEHEMGLEPTPPLPHLPAVAVTEVSLGAPATRGDPPAAIAEPPPAKADDRSLADIIFSCEHPDHLRSATGCAACGAGLRLIESIDAGKKLNAQLAAQAAATAQQAPDKTLPDVSAEAGTASPDVGGSVPGTAESSPSVERGGDNDVAGDHPGQLAPDRGENGEPLYHAACLAFPEPTEPEMAELIESVRVHGVQHEGVLFKGKVLDGRSREIASRRAGVRMRWRELPAGIDPIDYVTAANVTRRNLTPGQLAMAAAALVPLITEAARERQRAGLGSDGSGGRGKKTLAPDGAKVRAPKAAGIAAAKIGAKARNVERALVVEERGAPETVAAARAGTLPLATAEMLAQLPAQEQTEAIAAGPDAVRAAAAKFRGNLKNRTNRKTKADRSPVTYEDAAAKNAKTAETRANDSNDSVVAFTPGDKLAGMQDVLWALHAIEAFLRASGAFEPSSQLERVRSDLHDLDELLAKLITPAAVTR